MERGYSSVRICCVEKVRGEGVGGVWRMVRCAGALARFAWHVVQETSNVGRCSTRKLTPLPGHHRKIGMGRRRHGLLG
jgi:hypothetical protein